jgi:uncharacterized RmlC-like cupin family protein
MRKSVTKEEMRRRVAKWGEINPSSIPLIDAVLPEYNRQIFNIIGRGVTEDATMDVAIDDAEDFHVAVIKACPGKGTGLHTHKTLEVFMPLTGTWSVQWGDQGENELTINQWDVISIPTGIMRGFRNDSAEEAVLLSILGGTDPGKVEWAESILGKVRAKGYDLDDNGNIIALAKQAT